MKEATAELGVPLKWGGGWRAFEDAPDFQLRWKRIPA